jgi:Holliday junction DNA helicase RuvA
MIARLRGKPVGRSAEGVVLDVNGVGYLVQATPRVRAAAGSAGEMTVETYLHVREDTLQLFGFADEGERSLFVQLLSISGVGPKVALAIVSSAASADLRRAIAQEDTARFEAIPGVGRKTAQRVVLELKGSIVVDPEGASDSGSHVVARDALVELGYSVADAEAVLAGIDPDLAPEERVRQALRMAA